MISFDKFEYYINTIKRESDFVDSLTEALQTEILLKKLNCQCLAIELISDMFHDTNDWLGYWIFELNFGSDYTDGCVTEADGALIPLRTTRELYDFLCANMKAGEAP